MKYYSKGYIKRNPPKSVKSKVIWIQAIKATQLPKRFAWEKHGGKLMSIYFRKLKKYGVDMVIRRGKKNTRVLLNNGDEILVPNSELRGTGSDLRVIHGGGEKSPAKDPSLRLVS